MTCAPETVHHDGRVIVEEGHLGLKAGSRCSSRTHLALYGLEDMELQHEEHGFDDTGALCVPVTEYQRMKSHPHLCQLTLLETKKTFQWRIDLRMP